MISTTPTNSYAWLPGASNWEDGDGVTFHLKGHVRTVPLVYYRKVLQYIVGLPMGKKAFPKVEDPQLFAESLCLIIDWKEDRANGFTLEISPSAEWFQSEGESLKSFEERKNRMLSIPYDPKTTKLPGRDYIPGSFKKSA